MIFLGSPPPTRGTLNVRSNAKMRVGITPAYAGNTKTMSYVVVFDGDHPRLRGEHITAVDAFLGVLGSPPPTRGTLTNKVSNIII